MGEVCEPFVAMLRDRFAASAFTTEDSIRYTFYAAASLHAGVRPIDVILEYPHPTIAGAEIDTMIAANAERESMAVEFKYDRANPGGSNQNRTQRAAAIFLDVFRLAKVPAGLAARRYMVYVTDSEMAAYLRNPANKLTAFFDGRAGSKLSLDPSWSATFAQTFRTRVEPHACSCATVATYSADFANGVCVRVYEVMGAANKALQTDEAD